ncbi:MAG: glycosyltransferase family 2 protein [Bacteroides sp.]|nr:glycosyltransferase family 2 protein [Bacteroides sp.]MBD5307447.1 glycosyltransferase family 2 protein [Bacteroides sp.]
MPSSSVIIAIIVLYNPTKNRIIEQLRSIESQVSHIIYIDNSNESLDFVKELEQKPNISIILNNSNKGIAKAQNQGINLSLKLKASHILLMDQDSIPDNGMVDELLNGLNVTDAGATGINPIDAYHQDRPSFGIRLKGIGIKKIPLSERFNDVSYMIASGTLIPVDVINKVGPMREDFFIDGVDFEWCLRAKSKGYRMIQCRDAKLLHELGNGTKDRVLNHSPFREYYIMRNGLRLVTMKHIPFGHRIRRMGMGILRIGVNCVKLRSNYLKADMKAILSLFRNNHHKQPCIKPDNK